MTTHFTFFASYYEAVEHLEPEIKAEFFDLIFKYALRDEEPKDTTTPIVKSLFMMAKPNLDTSKAKREAGKAGGKQKLSKAKQSPSDKEKEKEKEKDNIERKKSHGFIAPTIADVKRYCEEKNYHFSYSEGFIDFYDSKGWKVGKNKMVSWRSALSGWIKRSGGKEDGEEELIFA